MPTPPKKPKPEAPPPPPVESFEEFDPTAEASTPETAEYTVESLGDAGDGEAQFRSLMQARDAAENTYLLEPSDAMAATAESGPNGLGNVVGVGIGEKYVDGMPTGQMAVKIFVKEKLSASDVSAEALVPQSLGGIQTDVDAVGEVGIQAFTARLRPAPCGVSIGNCRLVMAGTLGCVVRRGGQLFILSNNHVMALSNTSPLGTGIPQPGRLDGGICNADVIASLTQFVPINFQNQCNFVDAAIARTSPNLVDRRIIRPGGGRQSITPGSVVAALGMQVQKSGRTTQYRRGTVDAIAVTLNVNYAPIGGVARFCRQFRVRGIGGDFSAPGDSGSLVTTWPANRPVGLLFAGGGGFTFCNDIQTVLRALGVTIVV